MEGRKSTRQPHEAGRDLESSLYDYFHLILRIRKCFATSRDHGDRKKDVITRPDGVTGLDIECSMSASACVSNALISNILPGCSSSFSYRPSSTYMRVPTVPVLIRTLYTLSNATTARFFNSPTSLKTLPSPRGTVGLKSMPTIPFLGSLFSSSAQSREMADYPVQKSDDEWRAVLNKGNFSSLPVLSPPSLLLLIPKASILPPHRTIH